MEGGKGKERKGGCEGMECRKKGREGRKRDRVESEGGGEGMKERRGWKK